MYKEMRNKNQALTREKAEELLINGQYGVLSTVGTDGHPCATPISYIVMGDKIYFHGAMKGQKADNIAHDNRVSFCVVGMSQPFADTVLSTYYESVMVFGDIHKVEDPLEKEVVMLAVSNKYMPTHLHMAPALIKSGLAGTAVYCINIRHITGKEKKGA